MFESTLEKLARIMARQYHIEVIFEGNQACTDGEKIILPYLPDLDKETIQDLNGYLDHEVSHCKFTEFPEIGKTLSKFHKILLNAVEDIRIEREMMEDYPGTRFHLEPLREKVESKGMIDLAKKEVPWPIRFIFAAPRIMQGKDYPVDAETKEYLDLCKEELDKLNSCRDTASLRVLTEKIYKKVKDKYDEKDLKDQENKNGKTKKSEDSDSDGDESGEGDQDKDSSGKPSRRRSKVARMLSEQDGKPNSEFDKHTYDIHGYINKKIQEQVEKDEKVKDTSHSYSFSSKKNSIPVTTRFDTVTDLSGKGDNKKYAKLKHEVQRMVYPVKAALERLLKVKENAKWTFERERGSVNPRSLSKLITDKNYRTVFREYTKTETNNVAVTILVDNSGSMNGKVEITKQAVVAMAEALKDLNIPFEVSGFHAKPDENMHRFSVGLGRENLERFNRTYEKLDLHIFKNFLAASLTGIERIFSGYENPDGECVAWAAKRLSERKEKRKILLVLSDGMPNTSDADNRILNSHLKHNVEQMKKYGIECIGIGIQTDAVKHFYPDYVVLNHIADLPRSTMQKLAKVIGE